MFLIICHLNCTAALRFIQCQTHGIRNRICIHDNMTFTVSRRTSDGLNQRSFRTKKSFLVRIQNRHQRNLRNIQPLSQKVDSNQYIKHIQTQIPDNFCTLQRINIRMQIFDPNTDLTHIIGQIFCHFLCQCRNQNFMTARCFFIDFADQVINLPLHRTHFHIRIQQTCRPDDLLRTQ